MDRNQDTIMQLVLKYNLPFTNITVAYQGRTTDIPDVLIDTGSGRTILAADIVACLGIVPSETDMPYAVRGVGGTELVFVRRVDYIKIGEYRLSDFETEIGGMDYGFEIKGIIGTDFLINSGAIINLKKKYIEFERTEYEPV